LVIAYRLYKYLEKAKDVEDREFVEAFAAFNELAAKHEGYECGKLRDGVLCFFVGILI